MHILDQIVDADLGCVYSCQVNDRNVIKHRDFSQCPVLDHIVDFLALVKQDGKQVMANFALLDVLQLLSLHLLEEVD